MHVTNEPESTGNNFKCGSKTRLGTGVNIGDNVTIGNDVRIGSGVTIRDGVYVGNNVIVGDKTTIASGTKLHDGDVVRHVYISSECYIGNNVIINKHTHLSHGSVVRDNALICSGVMLLNDHAVSSDMVVVSHSKYKIKIPAVKHRMIRVGSNNADMHIFSKFNIIAMLIMHIDRLLCK